MKRKSFGFLSAFLFLSTVGITAPTPPSQTKPQAKSPQTASQLIQVVEVKGKVTLTPSVPPLQTRELKAKDWVQLGDQIRGNSDSAIKLTLIQNGMPIDGPKEAALAIKGNSQFVLTKNQNLDWILQLDQGSLLAHVRHSPSRASHFQVQTKAALIGTRGSTFFVKSEPSSEDFLCSCNGIVFLNQQAIIRGVHHNAPQQLIKGTSSISSRMKKAPSQGKEHTDEEITALEKLLN